MQLTENCSILAAALGPDETMLIAVMNDQLAEQRVQHSIPLVSGKKGWGPLEDDKVLPLLTAGCAPLDGGKFLLVGWAGQALEIDGTISEREVILRDDEPISLVRKVASIAGRAWVCCMRRQVYARTSSGEWIERDRGAWDENSDPMYGFECIDGFGTDEIYAVGSDGEIWRSDGTEWRRVESLTNVPLHAVTCATNGQVYAGGRLGVLLSGRNDVWRVLDFELDGTIWALRHFNGRLFVFSDEGTFIAREDGFDRVEDAAIGKGIFHTVAIGSSGLWCFGRKQIVLFDGNAWRNLPLELAEPVDPEVSIFFDNSVLQTGSVYLEDE